MTSTSPLGRGQATRIRERFERLLAAGVAGTLNQRIMAHAETEEYEGLVAVLNLGGLAHG